jgi:hypothetical protein
MRLGVSDVDTGNDGIADCTTTLPRRQSAKPTATRRHRRRAETPTTASDTT